MLTPKRRWRFTTELGEKFKVKSMVEKFGVAKTSKTPASSEVSTLPQSGEVPVPGGRRGAHVDGNDDTAEYCARGTRCGQVLETLDWHIT